MTVHSTRPLHPHTLHQKSLTRHNSVAEGVLLCLQPLTQCLQGALCISPGSALHETFRSFLRIPDWLRGIWPSFSSRMSARSWANSVLQRNDGVILICLKLTEFCRVRIRCVHSEWPLCSSAFSPTKSRAQWPTLRLQHFQLLSSNLLHSNCLSAIHSFPHNSLSSHPTYNHFAQ